MAGFNLYPILVIHHGYKSICSPDSSYEMWPLIFYITYQNVHTRSIQYKRCQSVDYGLNLGMYRTTDKYDLVPFPYPETNRVWP